ncbi:APH(3') family aminoglycoside O-phosphotransferase [Pararhizobium sp. A13]|uniref:APH(3') family aminoglycoside O-phosphotransferase n=1 Tax=Pararhizobium sp. A13 TaxID=3133975 RepID=UPI003256774B
MSELPLTLNVADLPPEWHVRISPYTWERDEVGRSSAGVFRLVSDSQPGLFLKCEPVGPFAELPHEAGRLQWLAGAGMLCPSVVAQEIYAGKNWLLTTAIPGQALSSSASIAPKECIETLSAALCRLHSIDIGSCPFDHRLANRLALAKERMEAGLVDESDFDEERLGNSAEDLFKLLEAQMPNGADLVVTHGDACLPNFMSRNGQFSGFVDCARLGVADRYQDIALAYWSVRYNLGEKWGLAFLGSYGVSKPDTAKLSYYQLLDEFF